MAGLNQMLSNNPMAPSRRLARQRRSQVAQQNIVNSALRSSTWTDTQFGGIDLLYDADGYRVDNVYIKPGTLYNIIPAGVNKLVLILKGEAQVEYSGTREMLQEGARSILKSGVQYSLSSSGRGVQMLLICSTIGSIQPAGEYEAGLALNPIVQAEELKAEFVPTDKPVMDISQLSKKADSPPVVEPVAMEKAAAPASDEPPEWFSHFANQLGGVITDIRKDLDNLKNPPPKKRGRPRKVKAESK